MVVVSRVRVLAVAVLLAFAGHARADLVRDVAFGLGYVGFDIAGNRNVLSDGADLLVGRTFVGDPLDFGLWDLTLSGPLSLEMSTANRGLPQFDLSLQTALSGDAAATPLAYMLSSDAGGRSTLVSGTVLLDANLTINGLGFYDLQFHYSSRQDVDDPGLASDTDPLGTDVGPISISGNLFADLLDLVTAPLFDQMGWDNPLERFSGRAQLRSILLSSAERTQDLLVAGVDPVRDQMALDNLESLDAMPADGTFLSQGDAISGAKQDSAARMIPEPSVLTFMLLTIVAIVLASRRRRHASRPTL